MFRARASICGVAVLLVAISGGASADAVVRGRPIPIRSAPWTVSVRTTFAPGEVVECSGSILDPAHVLTAAHCLFSSKGLRAQPSDVAVEAGVSNIRRPGAADARQVREAASLDVFPGYVNHEPMSARLSSFDVAVVRLESPFDLDRGTARAISLPSASATSNAGALVELAAFGQESENRPSTGALEIMSANLLPSVGQCSSSRLLCARSESSSPCAGDSGAGLVTAGVLSMTVVGVMSSSSPFCLPGFADRFVNLRAPAVRRFIVGAGVSQPAVSAPAGGSGPAGWVSYDDAAYGLTSFPLVISFPPSWVATRTEQDSFTVWDPRTKAQSFVEVSSHASTMAGFFRAALTRTRSFYLGQDPKAVVRSQTVRLPGGGTALEVVVRTLYQGSDLSIQGYYVFHDGTGYLVDYQGPRSEDAADAPVFERSARTIRFVDPAALPPGA